MPHLTLTSKRQVTFPAETCEALGLKPGDVIDLEPLIENGERRWLLRPRPARSRRWVGSLQHRTTPVKSHAMAAIRRSIGRARRDGGLA
jgi:bifunctional DNA-binding transcriptional regulator/antitoxin component of YhaV-PrlF toxin-antitoxin module